MHSWYLVLTRFVHSLKAIKVFNLKYIYSVFYNFISWSSFLPLQLSASNTSDEERKVSMNSVNPRYILRNYLCQSAIDIAESGDFGEVRRLLKVMERPYDDQPGMEKYARLPPAWAYRPGVCMLSCSSWFFSLHSYKLPVCVCDICI